MRYDLDASARLLPEDPALVGGSPLKLFRLTPAGGRLLARIAAGEDVGRSALVDRLVDAGALHPKPTAGPFSANDVTVVIPTRDDPVDTTRRALGEVGAVIIVDDGSQPPLVDHEVIRRDTNGGPAAARNTGLREVCTPLVAFVDADCVPTPGWLDALLPHFADDRVALVAPRVRTDGTSVLARYETQRSPLDLGPQPARVRARTRVSYVPAACVVARAQTLQRIGGFDESLVVGEDVDLVWRLDEAGHAVRYEPAATVMHAPRPTLSAWLRQRRDYGRSAAPLAERHPGALAPLAVSGWSAATWALLGLGHPLAALGVAGGTTAALARKLGALRHPNEEALRLAGRGHLHAGRQVASALTRAWWPAAVAVAVAWRRARPGLAAAALAPALADWLHERPPLDPFRYLALRLADDVAYGVGLWEGALQSGRAGALLPDLASWPKLGSYERILKLRRP